ncbi:MAG: hypothetical protein ACOZFS_15005 [Thermodesulfobacteriota bacterium]
MTPFLVVVGAMILGYLFLKALPLWIYRYFDRARRRDTGALPKSYEVPRYYTLKPSGEVDPSRRWPGWDGWYFFGLPDDRQMPIKMVRASLMTGLYGLEGIDTYAKLPLGRTAFDVVEYLILAPMEDASGGGVQQTNRFCQHYLPKAATLTMRPQELEVAVTGNGEPDVEAKLSGKIQGAWPHYQLEFRNRETGINFDLTYHGENVLWWADLPFFTYFAALGRFAGTITFSGDQGPETVLAFGGRGAFEHGFARKPCNFDTFWLPVQWLQKLMPSLRPVRYHYELLLGDGPHQGGFMFVRAFGITWRNHGGLFVNGSCLKIHNIEVDYLDDPPPDLMPLSPGVPPVKFYRSWKIKAETTAGKLEYVGLREWPAARIASNMMYYNFSYEGTFQGERISGRGYGEYLHM